jgi:DNA-binding XRE family transcriptional regulator
MSLNVVASRDHLAELIRRERHRFAAKIRMARALLYWNQGDLALQVGMTQRAIHKLEQGETEPRRATVYAIETLWREHGLEFEDLPDGGFQVVVRASLLDPPARTPRRVRRHPPDLGVTAVSRDHSA